MFQNKNHCKTGGGASSRWATRMAMTATLMLSSVVPALAADYFIVVPVKGRVADPYAKISLSLNSYVLPDGKVGDAYAFDFKPLLSVIGDPDFSAGAASWEIAQGALPAGVTLSTDTGLLSGTPQAEGPVTFSTKATYKTKTASQVYSFNVAPETVDPHWNNVVLLATAESGAYKDLSKYAVTLSAGGGVSADASLAKFPGTSSMKFTGSSTGISVPYSSSKFDLTSTVKTWTVEAWVYLQGPQSSIGTYRLDVVGNAASTSGWEASIGAGNVGVIYPGYGGPYPAMSVSSGQWHHMVWQRNGTAYSFAMDGQIKAATSYAGGMGANSWLRIGSNFNNGVGITYNLQEIRITAGVARYPMTQGATYAVPTDKFPRK